MPDEMDDFRNDLRSLLRAQVLVNDALKGIQKVAEKHTEALIDHEQRFAALVNAQTRTEQSLARASQAIDALAAAQARTEATLQAWLDQMRGQHPN